jgi:hypothetical protein
LQINLHFSFFIKCRWQVIQYYQYRIHTKNAQEVVRCATGLQY